MPELNVQQKIITFATSFGVTYVLLGLNIKVVRATFKFLTTAFDNKDREEIRQRRLEEKIRRRIEEEERRIEEEEKKSAGKTD